MPQTQVGNTYPASVKRSYWVYDCNTPDTEDIISLNERTTWTLSNDPETRVKPDENDLIWNPTSSARQIKLETSLGYSKFVHFGRSYDFTCGWPAPLLPYTANQYYRYFWEGGAVSGADPSGLLPAPDWTLPLRLRIKDDMINLGASIAEYKQSVRMFGSAATGIRDAVRSIRRLRFMKNRSLCSLTSAHLIHDYGVAPLMSDLFDSVEALRLGLERPLIKRYSFAVKGPSVKTSGVISSLGTNGRLVTTGTRRTDIRVVAYVEFDKDKLTLFTLGNPAEILWEITPFSFVIDWMIPIGDWLISLDATRAIKRVRGTVTTRDKYDQISDVQAKGNYAPDNDWTSGQKMALRTIRGHKRDSFMSIPIPPLPSIDVRGSISTLLNAMSLLVSVRGCRGVMPRYTRKGIPGA